MQSTDTPFKTNPPCAICGGTGELIEIDEEVGCQVTVPCWSCQAPQPSRPPSD